MRCEQKFKWGPNLGFNSAVHQGFGRGKKQVISKLKWAFLL